MTLRDKIEKLKERFYANQGQQGWNQDKADAAFQQALRRAGIEVFETNEVAIKEEHGKIEFYQDEDYFYSKKIR